jgi:hypothetical protein
MNFKVYLGKDENVNVLADFHNILNRQKNYFSHLLNVHGFNGDRQSETHTAKLKLKLQLKSSKGVSHEVLVKIWQN